MLSFDATQQTIVDSKYQALKWLFKVEGSLTKYWSTAAVTYASQSYEAVILPSSFSGISMTRPRSEAGIQAPNNLTFTASNPGDTLAYLGFESGARSVLVQLVGSDGSSETILRQWKFRIVSCRAERETLKFVCRDAVSAFLEGDWPNTKNVGDLAPESAGTPKDSMCLPVPFGTAYVPLRSLYITDARYYMLGPADSVTYTISKVRSPRKWGSVSVWDSGTYTMTQSTKVIDSVNYRVFQPIIADSDDDGTADACGLWRQGDQFLDMPVKFSRSDTSSITNPADVLAWILEDMGVPAALIDTGVGSSFEAAATTFTGWGLTWSGAFTAPRPRRKVIAELLVQCHAVLDIEDKIKLRVLSKTSQKAIDSSFVLNQTSKTGLAKPSAGTFKMSPRRETINDSGFGAFQEADEPADELIKVLVSSKTTSATPESTTFTMPLVHDGVHCQKLTCLALQPKQFNHGDIDWQSTFKLLALQPGDVVTLDAVDYGGGTIDLVTIVDQMTVKRDGTISFRGFKVSGVGLDDWGDLTFGAVSPASDDSTAVWDMVTVGPNATSSSGDLPNVLPGKLRIGSTALRIELDPLDGIAQYGTTEQVASIKQDGTGWFGTASAKAISWTAAGVATIAGFTASATRFYSGSNIVLDASAKAISLVSETFGQTGIQLQYNGGTPRFFVGNPAANYLRYDGTNVTVVGGITATTGTIGGWTIGTDKISITGIELDQANNRVRAYTGSNYVDLTAGGVTGYDSVLGTTFRIPTDGSAPYFASGEIREVEFQMYTSGVIQTSATAATTGGLLINNTQMTGYDTDGTVMFQSIWSGTDKGDLLVGDYAGDNAGLFYDHSAGVCNARMTLSVDSFADLPSDEYLVAHWSMDASGLPQDNSGNGNHATATTGTPDVVAGVAGYGRNFANAALEYYTIPDDIVDVSSDTFALAFACYPATGAATGRPRAIGIKGTYGLQVVRLDANEWSVRIDNGGTEVDRKNTNTDCATTDDAWYWLVVNVSGGAVQSIIVNGYSQALTVGSAFSGTALSWLGGAIASTGYSWHGKLDEVRIYKGINLTEAQAQALMLYPSGTGSTVISGNQITVGAIQSTNFDVSNGLKLDLDNATLTVNEASGLVISSTGGVTVAGGGDITLTGSDTDPGLIFFGDSSQIGAGVGSGSYPDNEKQTFWYPTANGTNLLIGAEPSSATPLYYSLNAFDNVTIFGTTALFHSGSITGSPITNCQAGVTSSIAHLSRYWNDGGNQSTSIISTQSTVARMEISANYGAAKTTWDVFGQAGPSPDQSWLWGKAKASYQYQLIVDGGSYSGELGGVYISAGNTWGNPKALLHVKDNGMPHSVICRLASDDGSPFALVVGNDSVTTTATHGLRVFLGGDGTARIDCYNNGAYQPVIFQANGGNVFIGETANSKMTQGLTINQGVNDDEILAMKSSDVAHPFTGSAEADTFAMIKKYDAAYGGARLYAFSDAASPAFGIYAMVGQTVTSSTAPIELVGAKNNGSGSPAAVGNSDAVLWIKNYTTLHAKLTGNGALYVEGAAKRVACGGGTTGAWTSAAGYVELYINGTLRKLAYMT